MHFNKIVGLVLLAMFSVNLYAGKPAVYITNNENRAYAGLVWALKDKFSPIPAATIGFRSVKVKSSDHVSGGDISARITFIDGIAFDSTRLSYVVGDRDVLGNLGIGFSNTNSSILGTAAIQSAYARLGSDFEFGSKGFVPYLDLLTLDKPRKTQVPYIPPVFC